MKERRIFLVPGCLQLGVGRTVLLHLCESRAPFKGLRVHQGAEISLKALQYLLASILTVVVDNSFAKSNSNKQIRKGSNEFDVFREEKQLPLQLRHLFNTEAHALSDGTVGFQLSDEVFNGLRLVQEGLFQTQRQKL